MQTTLTITRGNVVRVTPRRNVVRVTRVTLNTPTGATLSATDPGAIGAGKLWIDTSAGTGKWVIYVRNAANVGWELAGGGIVGNRLSHPEYPDVYIEFPTGKKAILISVAGQRPVRYGQP